MFTRTSSAAALLLLAACGQEATVAPVADPDDLVECALGGAGAFARDCVVERSRGEEGLILVVRHPDGGFRRFVATGDVIATADGAEPATLSQREDGVEVVVGDDHYRFPAAMTGDGAE